MTRHFNAGILGTGSMLPEKRLTNADLEQIVETSDEWILKRTGIRERRILDKDMKLSELASKAALKAINNAGLTVQDIELILVATITPDYLTPSLSCLIQKELGATKAAALDLNAACTGFIYALSVAQSFIQNGTYKYVLVVSAEALSRVTDFADRKTCVLFGDGSGAAVLGRTDETLGIEQIHLGAMGDLGQTLTLPCFYFDEADKEVRSEGVKQVIWMDGSEVFAFASKIMAEATEKVLEQAGASIGDVKYIFPHQANMRILQNAAKRLTISMDKVYSNLEYTGNISSASIPVCLDEAIEKGLLKKGDNIVLVAFGGGLTYGAVFMKWCY